MWLWNRNTEYLAYVRLNGMVFMLRFVWRTVWNIDVLVSLKCRQITLTFDIAVSYVSCANLTPYALQWRNNERDGVSKYRRLDYLPNCLFRRRSKLRASGLYEANPPVTGGFPSQRARNAENTSIRWRPHMEWWNDNYVQTVVLIRWQR